MAHKITETKEAIKLLQGTGVSLDTLTSGIVRGRGYNMTDSKAEFFAEYAKVSGLLVTAVTNAIESVFEAERKAKAEAKAKAKAEAEAKAKAEAEAKAEA